jgi:hypothetical protein
MDEGNKARSDAASLKLSKDVAELISSYAVMKKDLVSIKAKEFKLRQEFKAKEEALKKREHFLQLHENHPSTLSHGIIGRAKNQEITDQDKIDALVHYEIPSLKKKIANVTNLDNEQRAQYEVKLGAVEALHDKANNRIRKQSDKLWLLVSRWKSIRDARSALQYDRHHTIVALFDVLSVFMEQIGPYSVDRTTGVEWADSGLERPVIVPVTGNVYSLDTANKQILEDTKYKNVKYTGIKIKEKLHHNCVPLWDTPFPILGSLHRVIREFYDVEWIQNEVHHLTAEEKYKAQKKQKELQYLADLAEL